MIKIISNKENLKVRILINLINTLKFITYYKKLKQDPLGVTHKDLFIPKIKPMKRFIKSYRA